ncbi:MAG: hypothetical protein GEU89_21540, partial [Kiloniellaceae bacterium]|nr:hypothetical protein [Kiloniellaceae bacterium]
PTRMPSPMPISPPESDWDGTSSTARCSWTRRWSAGSGFCSRVSSARCAISTGASTRMSRAPARSPAARASAPDFRRSPSTRSLAWPRPTPRPSAQARCPPSWKTPTEYGTSTGRARRCGWYDAVAVRFSVRLAGYSSIALTKLDVLDGFERLRIATAYRDPADGREWTTVPASTSVYERLEPVYEE